MTNETGGAAPGWIELRPDADGGFDELVATFADGGVHVEALDDGSVYIGIHKPGQGPPESGLQLWITSRGKLRYRHESMTGAASPAGNEPREARQ